MKLPRRRLTPKHQRNIIYYFISVERDSEETMENEEKRINLTQTVAHVLSVTRDEIILSISTTWALYSPRATSGPLAILAWPA